MRRPGAVALVVLLCAAASADARPGDLDKRYGSRGLADTRLVEGAAVATLGRDGQLVAAGGTYVPSVARFTARGRLDRTYGVRRFRAAQSSRPFAIRRGADGSVLVASGAADIGVPPVQLLRTSTVRTSFTRFPHPVPFPGPIAGGALRPDGGALTFNSAGAIRAIRPDGGLDSAFGGGTVDVCAQLGSRRCTLYAIAVARDGTLVAGVTTARSRLLVRLSASGAITRRTKLPVRPSVLHVARDGAVLVASDAPGARMARVTAAGRVAKRVTRLPASIPQAITTTSSGRAYVLLNAATNSYVAQVTPSGRLVRRFGRRGLAGPVPRRTSDEAISGQALVLDGRGGLLVAGKRFLANELGGVDDPALGCDFREDTCASEVHLAAWRIRLR